MQIFGRSSSMTDYSIREIERPGDGTAPATESSGEVMRSLQQISMMMRK